VQITPLGGLLTTDVKGRWAIADLRFCVDNGEIGIPYWVAFTVCWIGL